MSAADAAPPPNRRPWLLGLIALVVVAVVVVVTVLALNGGGAKDDDASAAAPSGASAAPKELRIAYQAIPNGDLVVKHERWLEQALPDTKITWTKFDSGGDVNTAVVAGSVDIGLAGSSPVTRGLSAPLNIAYQVPWIFDVIGDAESLVVRKETGITDVKGLAGKKIATPFASTSHYSLLAALKEAGVAEQSVKIVDLEPPDILAAWKRGAIDAAYVWTPVLAQLQADGTTLTTSTKIAEAGYPTFDLAVVTKQFEATYPEAVSTWLKQQDRAVKLIKTDPAAAAKAIGAELNLSPEEAQAQLKGLTFLDATEQRSAGHLGTKAEPGEFAQSLLQAAEFLKSQQKIDAVPPLETFRAGIAGDALDRAFG